MLECQWIIKLSWIFSWQYIFTRGTRWLRENQIILTFLRAMTRLWHKIWLGISQNSPYLSKWFWNILVNIGLSWKFVCLYIFIQGLRWSCQNYNILTVWCFKKYLMSSHRTAENFIQMMLECQKMKWDEN